MTIKLDKEKLKITVRDTVKKIDSEIKSNRKNKLVQFVEKYDWDREKVLDNIPMMYYDLSKFMRVFFWFEAKFQNRHPRAERQSLRGLWYINAKNLATFWAGVADYSDDEDFTKVENFYGTMNSVLTDLVKRGVFDYDNLRLVDKSRKRIVNFDSEVYSDGNIVIIASEKEDFFEYLDDCSNLMDYSLVSLHGQPSLMATFDIAKQIVNEHGLSKEEANLNVVQVGDYDFHGFNIQENFIKQLRLLGFNVNPIMLEWWKEVIPNFDRKFHKEYYDLYVPLKLSNSGLKRWAKNHGIVREKGENKQYFGIEVNVVAKDPRKLRRLIWDILEENDLIKFKTRDRLVHDSRSPDVRYVARTLADEMLEDHPITKQIERLREKIRQLKQQIKPLKDKYKKKLYNKLNPEKWAVDDQERHTIEDLERAWLNKQSRFYYRNYSSSYLEDRLKKYARSSGYTNIPEEDKEEFEEDT